MKGDKNRLREQVAYLAQLVMNLAQELGQEGVARDAHALRNEVHKDCEPKEDHA